jgi:hypothetical protein
MTPYYAELSFGGTTLHLSGSADDGIPDGLGIAKEGIEGLLSSPALKVTATERSYGNGGHDVAESDVQYAARTLTVHFAVLGGDRNETQARFDRLAASAGRIVRLRVVDASRDVYINGYCQRDVDAAWYEGLLVGSLTIVCQRPELLSWSASQAQLMPVSRVRGGLSYGPEGKGLSYGPDGKGLSYGVSADGERNLAVLSNHGTTNAYPTITVTGTFPDGVEIQTGVGGVIRYTGAIGMVPLVIQCDPRNVAASMGGVDVGRNLTGRDLPAIPAGGSMSLRLMSAGSGWVTVTVRDTYL